MQIIVIFSRQHRNGENFACLEVSLKFILLALQAVALLPLRRIITFRAERRGHAGE